MDAPCAHKAYIPCCLMPPPTHLTVSRCPSPPLRQVSCVDRHVLRSALSESCGEEEEAAKGDLVVACLGFLRTLTLHTHTYAAHGFHDHMKHAR